MSWILRELNFDPQTQHHKETIFTIGNGYLSTRGAFEEGYPGDMRATFAHGVFDDVPLAFTELANTPDWLPLSIHLNDERFSMDRGTVENFERSLDLRNGLLKRSLRWLAPSGCSATIVFERFTSLANQHTLFIRCQVTPDFEGTVEFRAALNGCTENQGLTHWRRITQGIQGDIAYLHNQTRTTAIDFVGAMQLRGVSGEITGEDFWNSENSPNLILKMAAHPGETLVVDKFVAVSTSRDTQNPFEITLEHLHNIVDWECALEANCRAWEAEWSRTDVTIDSDEEVQLAIRFNLFQLLIAAPRHDDQVSIGAKTLSGFGYRGHSFWDTEIFILPMFTYTSPHIARNLLNYRYHRLAGARQNALENGFEGAQFPWESADSGKEVTPTWVPDWTNPKQAVRIWTGDIEIHISADIAYTAYQYWQVTCDDIWMVEKGAELILDTARFWGSRAEWDDVKQCFVFTDVIGPDEYHDHVDNNWYTNRMAQWNIQSAFEILEWLKGYDPNKAKKLIEDLDLSATRLRHWQNVVDKMFLPMTPSGLIEQFEGYFQRQDICLTSLEPRTISAQVLFGIEACNKTQVLKQPDVLMLQFLLRQHFLDEHVRVNYDYYSPRTDHTYGSSLGPAIQAIMACEVGCIQQAYDHFMRAIRADLHNVRGNAEDGIHAASAGGTWMALVFGFAGLRLTQTGWEIHPRLPEGWNRLKFKFYYQGEQQLVDIVH